MEVFKEDRGIKYLTLPTWQEQGVKIGFSLRYGGESVKQFENFNQGLHVGDNPTVVVNNRSRFLRLFGGNLKQAVCCEQVHGNRVFKVTAEDIGSGAHSMDSAIRDTDALVTDLPNVYLLCFFADCLPVFLFSPEQRAIGLAHSGWKGTFANIAGATVEALKTHYNAEPDEMLVYIGPGIHAESFCVGEELVRKLEKEAPEQRKFVYKKKGNWHWDLYATNEYLLRQSGLKTENIKLSEHCTVLAEEAFFSYRRTEGKTGRMVALLALDE